MEDVKTVDMKTETPKKPIIAGEQKAGQTPPTPPAPQTPPVPAKENEVKASEERVVGKSY